MHDVCNNGIADAKQTRSTCRVAHAQRALTLPQPRTLPGDAQEIRGRRTAVPAQNLEDAVLHNNAMC